MHGIFTTCTKYILFICFSLMYIFCSTNFCWYFVCHIYTTYIPYIYISHARYIPSISLSYDIHMLTFVLFSGFCGLHFTLPVTNPLDIQDDPHTDPHDPSDFELPDRICTVEGARCPSAHVPAWDNGRGTQFSGPNKLVYKCSNFRFQCFAPAVELVRSC